MSNNLAKREEIAKTGQIIVILDTMFLARNDGTRPEAINAMADFLAEKGYSLKEISQAAKELTIFDKKFGRVGIPEIVEKIHQIRESATVKRLPEQKFDYMALTPEKKANLLRKAGFTDLADDLIKKNRRK